jgi:hypothetical protein
MEQKPAEAATKRNGSPPGDTQREAKLRGTIRNRTEQPQGSDEDAKALSARLAAVGDSVPLRQRLVLAAWAASPPGEKVADFAARVGVGRTTWHHWQQDPRFADEFERVVRHRARLNLEFFAQNVARVDDAVLASALEGNVPAASLFYRRMGILTEKVDLTTEQKPEPEPSLEELEERLAQLQNVIDAGAPEPESS